MSLPRPNEDNVHFSEASHPLDAIRKHFNKWAKELEEMMVVEVESLENEARMKFLMSKINELHVCIS